MTDEVKHTPKRVGVSGDLFARTAAERDRLREVNADLLAALDGMVGQYIAFASQGEKYVATSDLADYRRQHLAIEAAALAAIARARGENL